MRGGVVLALVLAAGVAAPPARAAVDLLQRLEEKGIITAEERTELAKEQGGTVTPSGKGIGLSWASEDGRFATTLGGYGQLRYTFQDKDEANNNSNFSVQRVRLGLNGHTFSKDLKYALSLDVYSGNQKTTVLEQYWVDYAPLPEAGLKAGQFKVPYGLQWNVSAASQQFVDRTTVDGNFRFDYDTGLVLHGKWFGGVLGYDAGVFNGEGKNQNNPDDKHLYVGRLTLQPLGKYANAESDTGRSGAPALLLGVGAVRDTAVSSHTRPNLNGRLTALGTSAVTSYNAFAGAKFLGASLQSEYHRRKIDPEAAGAAAETAVGFYAQGGYLVWGKTLEVAARYEYFDPNDDAGGDLKQQYGLGG
ncbi:MAG: porin [Deferrisomatales bacterium]|nr:porin [Deferrisomatales bacterium]